MSLRLYDTASRAKREFVPIRPGAASIYLCGATVQGIPHIGHVRSAVNYDLLQRWLTYRGLNVALIRNVTNIDDKILAKAAEAGQPWWQWATAHERAFIAAYDALGCLPTAREPRAADHIPQMVEIIERLIRLGHAYASEGSVYFAVRSFPGYGALSGQRLSEMRQGEPDGYGKREAEDFTMWKAAKPGEPSWDTPWGPGRPGWHIECSAMAATYFGPEFDIHGGGIDLIFPHHENERAQSLAAGDDFARYWTHNAWVTMSGDKMSKSLGNTVAIHEMLKRFRAPELRYYLASKHYRATIEYSEPALWDSVSAYERIEDFLLRVSEGNGVPEAAPEMPAEFAAAMDDDLGTPAAMAVLHRAVREGNTALDAGDTAKAVIIAADVRAMTAVLGLDPLSKEWFGLPKPTEGNATVSALASLVEELLAEYGASNQTRELLSAAGIAVADRPDGPRLSARSVPLSGHPS
jgi:cysteinyl-tRNA synthetase